LLGGEGGGGWGVDMGGEGLQGGDAGRRSRAECCEQIMKLLRSIDFWGLSAERVLQDVMGRCPPPHTHPRASLLTAAGSS
jgi:hypothetical protein